VANRLANEFLRVKMSGMLILNVALEGDPEFPPEKKTKLLLELDRRIDGSTASDLITH
jgi:hypothetical protein